MELGFIGLGHMGQGMALNLVRAGHHVRVWNRSPDPVAAMVREGAVAARTPAEAAGCEVLFSMLSDDQAARSVILNGGVLEALPPDGIHVNMATISVALAHELAARHHEVGLGYVAAPVMGRPDVAAAGMLNILAAGPDAALERVLPLFEIIGQRTWRFGEVPEQANAVKLAANFCLGAAIEAMAESSTLVRAHGVSAPYFLEMLTSTLFAAPAYKGYGALISEERYSPAGFKLMLGLKDMRLALEAGGARNVPMPLAALVRDNLLDAAAHGDGELDWAALAKVAVRRAGLG